MLTLEKATELRADYLHIIGMKHMGGEIFALVIMPRNDPEFTKAMQQYGRTLDSDVAYKSSSDRGYSVFAMIDQESWDESRRFYSEIFGALDGLGIYCDYQDYT